MEQRNLEIDGINIMELLYILLRKWWLIALVCILGVTSAGLYTYYFVTPIYTSTSMMYVINRQNGETTTMSDLQFGAYITQDLKILVKSQSVTEEVIRKLNLNMTSDQLANIISVGTLNGTRFMEITVYHPDPKLVKQLVDAVAEVSSECMVSVMQMEKVDVVEEGKIPTYPSSPNFMRNMMLGGLLGAILTSAIIILVNLLNDTIRTTEEIEKYLGITSLGIIPLEEVTYKKDRKHKRSKRKEKVALAS